MEKNIVIIGSGFSSLSAASYLASKGYKVRMLEKNNDSGGRASIFIRDGFKFDKGPTFYWMPDVFESFFGDFGKKVKDYYRLKKLNPAYQVYFGKNDSISIADRPDKIIETFESIEKGSGKRLKKFLNKARKNYEIAIRDLVYQPGRSILEIVTLQTIIRLPSFIDTIKKQVARYIKNEKLRKILEFPVLFLGAKPSNTPAFYNFMNYADLGLGTWHPEGGMFEVAKGMEKLALELGVEISHNTEVQSLEVKDGKVHAVKTNQGTFPCDVLLSGADYHHTESLLPPDYRQYSEKYWDKRTFAPSALLFYIAFDKKMDKVSHHTLFFDTDFERHAKSIYDTREWPDLPLFYGSFPGKSDKSLLPEGKESAIILIPLAPDLEDTPEIREKYFNIIIDRMEMLTDQSVREHVLFKESYCVNDFKEDYNSYKGNAYGLANTLFQTHILRPRLKSKKVSNLYFTGQLTLPGPGVPPSIISGKIVSQLIEKNHKI